MRQYNIVIEGQRPLLMHPDSIDWSDKMDAWRVDPANKAKSKAGDDRTPPWRWIGNLYHDGNCVVMPQENIMKCLSQGGAMVSTGKGKKTFKEQSQSGIISLTATWPVLVGDSCASIPVEKIFSLMDDSIPFDKQADAARELGFELHLRRARIGTAKHIRVRPMFRKWRLEGVLATIDDAITEQVLKDILTYAGTYKGLGDWRPGCSTPGQYGVFSATVESI